MLKKSLPYLLVAIGIVANLCVWVFDPGTISRGFLGRFMDWQGDVSRPALPAAETDLQEAMGRISAERIAERIRVLSAQPSRTVGYPGNREAYEYVRGEFERIGLEEIRTDTPSSRSTSVSTLRFRSCRSCAD